MRRAIWMVGVVLLGSGALLAQNVISARSGLVHYTEGKVLLAGRDVEPSATNFPDVKEKQELRTAEGRAEVLLTPGVFLRMGESTAFRMISSRLTDSRIEFLEGAAVIEAADLLKDNAVTVSVGSAQVHLKKNGIYRFDSDPMRLRVFAGEALVETSGTPAQLKEGRMITFEDMQVARFDAKLGDALNRWSRRRAEYISLANISAAKSLYDSGATWNQSGWRYNPYFGMFTFIPFRGAYYSPYGYRYWSPVTVYRVYQPQPVYSSNSFGGGAGHNPNLGYATASRTSGGYSGAVATAAPSVAAPTTSAAGAASAPVSRGSGHAGGGRQ